MYRLGMQSDYKSTIQKAFEMEKDCQIDESPVYFD